MQGMDLEKFKDTEECDWDDLAQKIYDKVTCDEKKFKEEFVKSVIIQSCNERLLNASIITLRNHKKKFYIQEIYKHPQLSFYTVFFDRTVNFSIIKKDFCDKMPPGFSNSIQILKPSELTKSMLMNSAKSNNTSRTNKRVNKLVWVKRH
jgi:hypothetical protein